MRRLPACAAALCVLSAIGCGTAQKRPPVATVTYDAAAEPDRHAPETGPLYFGFDEHTLSPRAQRSLHEVAGYLRSRPSVRLTVEGHCDELGTSEYNLALGHSRALAAKRYLVALGVEEDRVHVVSFGEERPVLSGTDDDARARNRRDELAFFSSAEAQAALAEGGSALDVVLAWQW